MAEWRAIPGFSDYAVSDAGEIVALRRSRGHRIGAPIKTPIDHRGYKRARLTGDDGRAHTVSAHIAVLEAFVSLRPVGHDGSHINGDRIDCRLANLCWETPSENHQRKLAHGTLIHGEKHKCSKLKTAQVIDIRARAARGEMQKELARQFGVSTTLICKIVARTAWMHAA